MLKKKAIIVPLLIAPTLLLAAEARRVNVAALVPPVTQIECPVCHELSPGEIREVTVRVASNQPWHLAIFSDNPLVQTTGPHKGTAGGMRAAGNTFTVTLTCAEAAVGPQRTNLATQLVRGPLVASLSR
jgi:hypothetical protein